MKISAIYFKLVHLSKTRQWKSFADLKSHLNYWNAKSEWCRTALKINEPEKFNFLNKKKTVHKADFQSDDNAHYFIIL